MEKEEVKKHNEGVSSGNKSFLIIGVVILAVFGLYVAKMLLSPADNYKVTLIDAPKEIKPGSIATFTWRVDGPPTSIIHTAVYLGRDTLPGELDKKTYPVDTKYTESVKDFMYGKFNIPLQFVGNTKMDTPGTYYFRVHATIMDQNYWSDEEMLEVR